MIVYEAGSPAPALRANEIALAQIPSRAFGDGSHPTTRLCAGAVDQLCRMDAPRAVLDVGTGTGVLARIARARGVEFVAGTDIDPSALAAARDNAALDAHRDGAPAPPTREEPIFEGPARDIAFTIDPPDAWGPRFDLVVANILEGPLCALAPAFSRAMAPGAKLLVSGFTRLQIPSLTASFARAGLSREVESSMDGWALLLFRLGPSSSRE